MQSLKVLGELGPNCSLSEKSRRHQKTGKGVHKRKCLGRTTSVSPSQDGRGHRYLPG